MVSRPAKIVVTKLSLMTLGSFVSAIRASRKTNLSLTPPERLALLRARLSATIPSTD